MYSVQIEFNFEAAHHLKGYVPPGHKCENLHGHTYRVWVTIQAQELRDGMIVEFGLIKDSVRSKFDHQFLNEALDAAGYDPVPTAEYLAYVVQDLIQKAIDKFEYDQALRPGLPVLARRHRPVVHKVVLQEGLGGTATWSA